MSTAPAEAGAVEVGLVGLRTFHVDRASGALLPINLFQLRRDPGG